MTPAAVLSLLVKAEGATAAAAQLNALESVAKKASTGMNAVSGAAERSSAGLMGAGSAADKAAVGYAKAGTAAKTAAAKQAEMEAASKRGRAAFDDVGRKAGMVSLGILGIGAAAAKTAGDYQQSMNVLQSVSGATGKEMDKLSKLAVKLGADTKLPGTSAKDASEAMTEMVKAGVSLKDTMSGVRGVLVLSAAAGVDNARAAEIASNALNAFRLKGRDVNMVVDQLANTANSSSVEINDVADSFKMAAAVFNAFQTPTLGAKKAMTELNVAIGLLGNAGIKGSDAGTSLKQALLQLTGPSSKAKDAMRALYIAAKDNSAGEKDLQTILRGTAEERGKAIDHMAKFNKALTKGGDIAYDARGKMRSLKDIIALVAAGTKKMTAEEKNAYLTQIFGADATRSVSILLQAQGKEWNKMEKAVKRHGAAQDLANSKMKGFKGSLEALKSSLETMAIAIGTKLLPALTAFVHMFTSALGLLPPGAWLVVIGVIGTLAVTIWTVNKAIAAYEAITKLATAAQWLFNAAITANPIVLAVAAVVALAAAFVLAYKKIGWFRNAVDAVWHGLEAAFNWVKDHWPLLLSLLIGPFGPAVIEIAKHFGAIKETVLGAFKAIGGVFAAAYGVLRSAAVAIVNGIKSAFEAGWGAIKALWSNSVGAIIKAVLNVADRALNAGRDLIAAVARGIGSAAVDVFGAAKARAERVIDAVRGLASSALDAGRDLIGAVARGLGSAAVDIFGAAKARAERILDAFRSIVDKAGDIGRAIVSAVANGIKNAAGFAKAAVNSIVDLLNNAIPNKIKVPGPLPDINLPDNPIPHLARGARNFRGGLAMVGERGPELVALPRGARVIPAGPTQAMLRQQGPPQIIVQQTIQTLHPGDPRTLDAIGRAATAGLTLQGSVINPRIATGV